MSNINLYIKPSQESIDPQCVQELVDLITSDVTQEQIESVLREYDVEYE
ncbi:hypothetical protein [Vallitalea guaymasensis]|nr:hypothetical protein [Vallitalea guaymasensis]